MSLINSPLGPPIGLGPLHSLFGLSYFLNNVTTLRFLGAAADASGAMQLQVCGRGTGESTHVSTILSPDHEGVYREFTEDEPVWRDGRVVENLLEYPEDFSQEVWVKEGGNTAPSANEINWVAGYTGGDRIRQAVPVEERAGMNTVFSVIVPPKSYFSDPDVVFYLHYSDGAVPTSFSPGDNEKKITTSLAHIASGTDINAMIYSDRVCQQTKAFKTQLEDSTGRQDTTTPSEYIAKDTPIGPELITNGDFSQWTDPTVPDGWTVQGTVDATNYIVENSSAARLVSDGTYVGIVQYVLENNKSYLIEFDILAISGEGKIQTPRDSSQLLFAFSTVGHYSFITTQDSVGGEVTISRSLPSSPCDFTIDNITVKEATTGKVVFNYENGNTVDIAGVVTEEKGLPLDPQPTLAYNPAATNIQVNSNDLTKPNWDVDVGSGAAIFNQVGLVGKPNTATLLEDTDGTIKLRWFDGSVVGVSAVGRKAVARFFIKKKASSNSNINLELRWDGGIISIWKISFNPVDGSYIDIDGAVGTHISEIGDFWVILHEAHNNDASNTAVTTLISPSYYQVGTSTPDNTLQGSCVVGNVEVHTDKTIQEVRELPPIITEAAPVPIDRTAYSFDNANIPDDNGVIFFETALYRGEVAADIVGGGVVTDNIGGNGLLYWNNAQDDIYAYDGTSASGYANHPLDTLVHKCTVVYDTEAGLKTLYIDGVQGTETAYDGDWGTDPLSLWLNQVYNQRGRNLQVWSGGSYQDKKDKAQELYEKSIAVYDGWDILMDGTDIVVDP